MTCVRGIPSEGNAAKRGVELAAAVLQCMAWSWYVLDCLGMSWSLEFFGYVWISQYDVTLYCDSHGIQTTPMTNLSVGTRAE